MEGVCRQKLGEARKLPAKEKKGLFQEWVPSLRLKGRLESNQADGLSLLWGDWRGPTGQTTSLELTRTLQTDRLGLRSRRRLKLQLDQVLSLGQLVFVRIGS